MNTWQVGDVRITSVVELEVPIPVELVLPRGTADAVLAHSWLRPDFATDDGLIHLRIQLLVVESQGRRIAVDTCVGNDKDRTLEGFHHLALPFLDDLTAAGFPPESIDTVVCTHLHQDHVGWNTRWVDGAWVPDVPERAVPVRPRRIRALGRVRRPRGRRRLRRLRATGHRGRPGGPRRVRSPDHRRGRHGTDPGSLARPPERAHHLRRRGGADHRRRDAPPAPVRRPRPRERVRLGRRRRPRDAAGVAGAVRRGPTSWSSAPTSVGAAPDTSSPTATPGGWGTDA